ncbi:hypothetical protein [Nocardia sp. NPDC059239]|uniref:hypothetical protein n=1 Tax=unclassified Nocardia TaxID=2637762 RepID=UPI0036CCA25C
MSTDHHAEAVRALRQLSGADLGAYSLTIVGEATARAMLAVGEHLGVLPDLVNELRKANVIAAFNSNVIEDVNEARQARAEVRAVLGLTTTTTGRPE